MTMKKSIKFVATCGVISTALFGSSCSAGKSETDGSWVEVEKIAIDGDSIVLGKDCFPITILEIKDDLKRCGWLAE